MAELKTKRTNESVTDFLNNTVDEPVRSDCFTIVEMMKEATKAEPKMWGPAIIGFGDYHYKYESGRENDWFIIGFSPRKQNITLYLGYNLGALETTLQRLGKYKTGKGCLYIKKISDIDQNVLRELIDKAIAHTLSVNQ